MPKKYDDDDTIVIDGDVANDLDTTPICIPRTPRAATDGLTPVGPRTATNEMEPVVKPLRVELDLDDPKSLADFLDHVARLIRARKRIILTIE